MDILDETIRTLREENQALREELAGKARGAWLLLHHINQIGLVIGEETIVEICTNMPNISMLVCVVGDGANFTEYPVSHGLLRVTKRNEYRCVCEFFSSGEGSWQGAFYGTTFRGWKKYLME